MKNILIFSTNYLPYIGGAEVAVEELTSRMKGYTFHVITPRYRFVLPKEEVVGRVIVHRVGLGLSLDKFLIPLLGYLKARSLSRTIRFDVSWSIMASQASIAAALFRRVYPCLPLLLTLQEGDEETHLRRYVLGNDFLYRTLIRPWHRLVFRRADFVTGIGEHLLARAKESGARGASMLVPNGVDVARFAKDPPAEALAQLREKYGITPTDRVIVSVSRLVEKNGLYELIEALSLLPQEYKLLIVGDGPLRHDLSRAASYFKVLERVVFAGSVIPEDIPTHLRLGFVFARPSRSEGFGNVFVEAMAAGVPVVATSVGGIKDFIVDKENGFLAAVGDAKDIALKIGQAYSDRPLVAEVIAAGKLTASQYDWQESARLMEEAFSKIVESTRFSILIATGIYPPQIGGPATYARKLSEALIKGGHRVTVLTYSRFERRLPTGIRHSVFFLRALALFPRHDFCIALDAFSVGFPAVAAGRLLHADVIVRVGGDFLWEAYIERTGDKVPLEHFYSRRVPLTFKERIIKRLIAWTYRYAHRVVFSTAWQRNFTVSPYGIPLGKSMVIENEYPAVAHTLTSPRKEFIVAGRAIRLKNFDVLRRAFRAAQAVNSTVVLEELRLPHAKLLERVRSAYAVIVPSVSEVSPNFIIEAVSAGKPFILTHSCGIWDRLEGCGLSVDPHNEKDITEKILSLCDERVYASLLERIQAFRFVHTYDDIAREFTHIISRTCER